MSAPETTKGSGSAAQTAADPAPLFLGDAIAFFLDAKRAGGRGEKTIDDYRKKLDLFQRWLASRSGLGEVDVPYASADADAVEAYAVYLKNERTLKDGKPLQDSTAKSHLAVLKSFFETASRRLKLENPMDDLDEVRFRQATPKRLYLTKEEAGRLFAPIDRAARSAPGEGPDGAPPSRRALLAPVLAARDHAAFSAMVYAGLRIEEAAGLAVWDLDLSRGAEEVRVAKGKGNKERAVPMAPKLKRSLSRYLSVRGDLVPAGEDPSHLFLNERGRRVSENTLRRRLYGWVREARLAKKAALKPHDLRRTFGTWYLQDNPGQLRELAELMGHSDLSQVMKYALSDAERARAGVGRL
ncbi:tyrosine-type recombinase/integrase [Rubrobacter tropicus]|uniref:Tyrosine-type recombinase/integrase n=1 Tax=Rubrobacter tropicus TaxID=2653851 RepID=A0A6G8QDQ7_9ACTN|nr:tyrosine-type recombinase/integrase [Rubrobacter tropicus]QIN84640.1 tyrosine-type recombinase/integrase [Rubrobacter tropicus]